MNEIQETTGDHKSRVVSTPPKSITVDGSTEIDLSWMSSEQREELLKEYVSGRINIEHLALKLDVETHALENVLQTLSNTTKEATDEGNSVTATHTQSSTIGKTEVIMGNTDHARKGKLSRSQTGERDWIPYYVFGAVAAIVLIVIAIAD